MRVAFLSLLAVLGAAACASSSQGAAEGGDNDVQLLIINQYTGTMTAYAVWGTSRIRLGDVASNRERTFFTGRRSDRVAVGLEAVGAPPPGTSAGPTRFGAAPGADPDPSAPYRVSESLPVVAGDAVEVRVSAAGIITVRRLTPGL